MPRLLYRYILGDVVRLVVLTTVVLVTVIAFGATLKPLASSMLLDATQTAKYMGLVIIPMLQFALPFAAGFGTTVALHRMVADNEVQAIAASGVSYGRILAPVFALGFVLCLLMVGLTQWVIPRFWAALEGMVTTDITRLLQASVGRGEPFEFGDLEIWADDIAVRDQPSHGDAPDTRMVLVRLAAAELDPERRVVTDVVANQAVVDVYRREGRIYLKLAIADAIRYEAESGNLAYVPSILPPAIVVPSALHDNPKAMTRGELLALRDAPDRFGQVIEARRALVQSIRESSALAAIDASLRQSGNVELLGEKIDPGSESRRSYVVHADRLNGMRFVRRDQRAIEIVQMEGGQPTRRFLASSAELLSPATRSLGALTFDLRLGEHEATDLRHEGRPNVRAGIVLPALSPPAGELAGDSLDALSSAELLERVDALAHQPTKRIAKLRQEILDMQREITSRLSNRYAVALTAFLLPLLGGILAMWLRGALPLTIYLWAFLPAVLDLILISAGEQVLRDGRVIGWAVMWSGNAIMIGLILGSYWRLARN